jgi:hypothetical protein
VVKGLASHIRLRVLTFFAMAPFLSIVGFMLPLGSQVQHLLRSSLNILSIGEGPGSGLHRQRLEEPPEHLSFWPAWLQGRS